MNEYFKSFESGGRKSTVLRNDNSGVNIPTYLASYYYNGRLSHTVTSHNREECERMAESFVFPEGNPTLLVE